MSFKYFLDMAPEENVINPSSLTKFRKLRLKDINLLDILISKTVAIAIENNIIKSKSIIVDATHTKSRYNSKTPQQALQEQSKKLCHAVYKIDENMKEHFPQKNTELSLEKEIDYCNKLIDSIKNNESLCNYPNISEKLNLLQETIDDDLEHLKIFLNLQMIHMRSTLLSRNYIKIKNSMLWQFVKLRYIKINQML